MKRSQERLIGNIIGVASFTIFVFVAVYTLTWVSGLRFDSKTNKLIQTSVVSVEATFANATVTLNGETIGTHAPLEKRNLLPGRYNLVISQAGYQSFSETFQLDPGQVHIVYKTTVLLANNPYTVKDATNQKYYDREVYDVGLAVNNGEIFDDGALVTRLSSNPTIVRRLNEAYVYQIGNQLRIYLPDGGRDNLVYTLSSSSAARININSGNWQIVVFDTAGSNTAQIINLTQTTH